MNVIYFESGFAFRQWLEEHHHVAVELWVGFYRKDSGREGVTYFEAVDEALCFGWIDGIRKRVDDASYTNRFTPRKARSIWSAINTKRVAALKKQGRMHAAGLKAYAARDPKRSGIYSFENAPRQLDAAAGRRFRANKKAWEYFKAQAPWYQRTAIWWIVNGKKAETREKRLAQLIKDSASERRLAHLSRPAKTSG